MRVPTVRVKHPSGDGFIIINVSDLTEQHEMLPMDEQDDLFDSTVLYQQLKPLPVDAALRDFAAMFCLEIFSMERESQGLTFEDLTDEEKLTLLREKRSEFVVRRDEFRADRSRDFEERLRANLESSPQPEATDVPGQIDGNKFVTTHGATNQDDSNVLYPKGSDTNQIAQAPQTDQSGGDNAGQSGQQSGQSTDQPLTEDPKLPILKIENSRGYFYVVADGDKVSKGHREIADARSDLDSLVAEGKGLKPTTAE